jgi:hypothetical protein
MRIISSGSTDGRPVWLIRCKVLTQVGETEYPIDIAKQVILRHNLVEIKRVKQLVLRPVVAAHHRKELRQSTRSNYLIDVLSAGVFQQ